MGLATVCAMITGFWLITFPIYVLFFINRKIKAELKSDESMDKYGTLYEEYRLKGFLSRNFLAIALLRKLSQILVLVCMQDTGIAQNWAFAGVNFTLLVILIYARPYKIKIFNVVEIVSEIFYLLSNFIFGCITINEWTANVNFDLGWIIITCLSSIVAVHFSLVIMDMIKDLLRLCKKKPNPHITKITPIATEESSSHVNDTESDMQSEVPIK